MRRTEVNPDTAERDAKPVLELRNLYGNHNMGVYLEVQSPGTVEIGDELTPA